MIDRMLPRSVYASWNQHPKCQDRKVCGLSETRIIIPRVVAEYQRSISDFAELSTTSAILSCQYRALPRRRYGVHCKIK